MSSTENGTMLDVQQLNKRFGAVHAVKDLSFQIKKGEVFGFLGPNGAGKTTTMRVITSFIPASSGSIVVDGIPLGDDTLEIRRKIGYLPENTPLYNDMLVSEYMEFVGEIRGLKGQSLDKRIDEIFQICGLTTMARRPIGKLSKGYRQRVGLAQALIHNPDLLILDEPMSGLDPNQIIEIRQLIKKIGQEKTVIYCSHILSEVSATCSRILIINDGKSVATGTPDELIARMDKGIQYTLRIKADKDSVESSLPSLNGVKSVTIRESHDGWHLTHVASDEKHDIGELLFKSAVDNGWVLSELKRETVSLEDVFTQLTRG
ncbi:MAG: ABC transporter ATP-binding protein [Chitinivibrionales bacterium]